MKPAGTTVAAVWLAWAAACGDLRGQQGDTKDELQHLPAAHFQVPPSPALAPEQAVQTIRIAPGFRIELFANEPMVQDPVALAFDPRGRLWIAEMRGFMPTLDGIGENQPVGRVSVLEDTDGDGRADRAKVFLDQLIMPRALAVVRDGLLVVSGGKLIFATDRNGDGVADQRKVIDPDYAPTGNVEHQANGLVWNLDNWIYNAKSAWRYRWDGSQWRKSPTEFRGQWGIARDDEGRLYYNFNWSQLHADLVPPNYFLRNPAFVTGRGVNALLTTNQSVYPIRTGTGVNRAYRPGVLDEQGRLREFTSASAPLVYRGSLMPELRGDALICEPAGNLIKRNRVLHEGLRLRAEPAYERAEFVASSDERFRPVTLAEGPEGAVYIADMYRGIIQHRQFATTHLRREIVARQLELPINWGRIYRVLPDVATGQIGPQRMPAMSESLALSWLSNPSGWHRDVAQRWLVDRADPAAMGALIALAISGTNALGQIHALWTLEGLIAPMRAKSVPIKIGNQARSALSACFKDPDARVQRAAIRVLEHLAVGDAEFARQLLQLFDSRFESMEESVRLQMVLSASTIPGPQARALLARGAAMDSSEPLIRDALFSRPQRDELELLELFLARVSGRPIAPGWDAMIQGLVSANVKHREEAAIKRLFDLAAAQVEESSWIASSILAGFIENTLELQAEPLKLRGEPPAVKQLGKTDNPRVRSALDKAIALIEWPGRKIPRKMSPPLRPLSGMQSRLIESGKLSYQMICSGCHGVSGEGMESLAPPLMNSEWVQGPKKRFILIALHGLEGPIEVGGVRYVPPSVQPNMPALETMNDFDLSSALSFVRRVLGRTETLISSAEIGEVRRAFGQRNRPWTAEELLAVDPKLVSREERE